jgi:hypothetical protein
MSQLQAVKAALSFEIHTLPMADINSLSFLGAVTTIAEIMEACRATHYEVFGENDESFYIALSGIKNVDLGLVNESLDTLVHDYAFDGADAEKSVTGEVSLTDYVNQQLSDESILNEISGNDFCEYVKFIYGKPSGALTELCDHIRQVGTESINNIKKSLDASFSDF